MFWLNYPFKQAFFSPPLRTEQDMSDSTHKPTWRCVNSHIPPEGWSSARRACHFIALNCHRNTSELNVEGRPAGPPLYDQHRQKNEDVEDCSDIGFAKDNYNKQLFKSNCSHSLNTPAGELGILKELFSYNQQKFCKSILTWGESDYFD